MAARFRMRPISRWLLPIIVLLIVSSFFVPARRIDAKELYGPAMPVWSPDGRQIAYTLMQPDRQDLYLLDLDRPAPAKLVENASEPAWSPDGTKIAYTQGAETLAILDVKSRTSTALTIGRAPQWSPDGKRLVYVEGESLHEVNADGSRPHRLIADVWLRVWGFWWSPNGQQIALAVWAGSDNLEILYLMNADGSAMHKIADSTYNAWLAWSPDGKQVVFIGQCGGRSHEVLCLADADGSNPHLLADSFGIRPIWSPDGRQILFTRDDGFCVVNADGTNQHYLTRHDHSKIYDFGAAWSPDSQWIVFMRYIYPDTSSTSYLFNTEMYLMSADGARSRRLPDGLTVF